MKKTNPFIRIAAGILILIGLIGFDQWTKHLAVAALKGQPAKVMIRNVLELQYLENRGMAFGLLQNKQWFFWILTAVFLIIAFYALSRIPYKKRYLPLIFTILVLVAGGVGNLIDRIANQYVVDFIYFRIINFPIFNVADIYVTLSVIALLILILFKYKDKDLHTLFRSRKKEKTNE